MTFSVFIWRQFWGELHLISECREAEEHIFLGEQTAFSLQVHIDPNNGVQLWLRPAGLNSLLFSDARKKGFPPSLLSKYRAQIVHFVLT